MEFPTKFKKTKKSPVTEFSSDHGGFANSSTQHSCYRVFVAENSRTLKQTVILQRSMTCSCYYVVLLFLCKVDEANCIT